MAKTPKPESKPKPSKSEMPEHYDFDYAKARPNRFATGKPAITVAVILDPDVAQVFTTRKSVNAALRALIPKATTKPRGRAL